MAKSTAASKRAAGSSSAAADTPATDTPGGPIITKLIPHESWVSANLIDTRASATNGGDKLCTYTFEVIRPRLYEGRTLYARISKHVDKWLATLATQFPGVDFLDEDDVWEHLGALREIRLSVAIDPERVDPETHKVYNKRNRVMGIYPAQGVKY